jgi:threonine dehydrogenase-like Zn-dependent dehydrogenase
VVQPSVTETIRVRGGDTFGTDAVKKILSERAPAQLCGHEFCGEVVEVGEGVTSIRAGDRVVGCPHIPCYECSFCRSGRHDKCRKGPTVGRELPGAFCEYLALPEEALVAIPNVISDNEAACLQPLSSCVPTIADAGIEAGDSIAIMGQGVMGLSILQLAKISGAGNVIGVDIRNTNLNLSQELGSDYQINASEVDPVLAVRELTGGTGVDIVFECAGGSPTEGLAGSRTLEQALELVADSGKIVQVAMIGGSIAFKPNILRKKSLKYIFPQYPDRKQMDHTVRVVANKQVALKPMITHVLHGLEMVPKAFEITASKAKYEAVNPAQVVVSE